MPPKSRDLTAMYTAVYGVSVIVLLFTSGWLIMSVPGSVKSVYRAYKVLLTAEGQVQQLAEGMLPRPQDMLRHPSRSPTIKVSRMLLCVDLGQGGGGSETRIFRAAQRMAGARLPEGSTAALADGGTYEAEVGAVTVLLSRKKLEWGNRTSPRYIGPPRGPMEGSYELEAFMGGLFITGEDERGLYHGLSTLLQILVLRAQFQPIAWLSKRGWVGLLGSDRLPPGITVPALRIKDWPSLANRGAMLDISRNRVHSLHTLKHVTDLLAATKLTQLQLYMEHTFAYKGHEVVWNNTEALTRSDIEELSEYCHERFVELVPNQQSFGHLQHWLKHDQYRHLAEDPSGTGALFNTSFCCSMWHDGRRLPYSLAPMEGALHFLAGLYVQLLPAFTHASSVNVGLDEVFDLGSNRTTTRVRGEGRGEVFLRFLLAVASLVRRHGKSTLFWGDALARDDATLARIPRDAVLLEWNYEAEEVAFELRGPILRYAKIRFYNCPGTSSWDTFGGRAHNALTNILRAATFGADFGAEGLLVTDWGDNGHLQPLPVSYLGLLSAADFSWSTKHARALMRNPHLAERRFATALDSLVLADAARTAGAALLSLGNAYRTVGAHAGRASALFHLLVLPNKEFTGARLRIGYHVSAEGLRKTRTELLEQLAALGRSRSPDTLALQEVAWVARALVVACDVGLLCAARGDESCDYRELQPGSIPTGEALRALVEELRDLWPRRAAPGAGLDDSVARLMHTVQLLLGEDPTGGGGFYGVPAAQQVEAGGFRGGS